jgi:XTP/dITP diphosphohydrolase
MDNYKNFIFASTNKDKASELEAILNLSLTLPSSFNVEETGETFLANALLKAEACYKLYHCPVLADDSGLLVKALPNDLGVRTARFGGEGLSQTKRNDLLLKKMQGIDNREAQFVCCLVLYYGPHQYVVSSQNWQGEIAKQRSGSFGFGYDPLFYLPNLAKTVADLDKETKNQLSHRAKAAKILKYSLLNNGFVNFMAIS